MTFERPRRISPPAPIGSMLKGAFPASNGRALKAEPRGGDDPDYLAKVRECPCLYCGQDPCGEAAHVRFASAAFGKASGLGKKPDDRWALPLCPEEHRNARHAQHNQNEEAFWAALGINPLIVCEQLYRQRGDMVAMRAVVIHAIMTRDKQEAAPIGAGMP